MEYWIYRIRALSVGGVTEAVYVGMSAKLEARWHTHKKEIAAARIGKASEFKYGFLATYPNERIVFEQVARVHGMFSALEREEFEIALVRKHARYRCLNVLVTNDVRTGVVSRTGNRKGWVISCRKGKQPGDEIIAVLPGSRMRGLVSLVARVEPVERHRTVEKWTFAPLGKRWQSKYPYEPYADRRVRADRAKPNDG